MSPKIEKLEFKCGQCKWLDTKYKGSNCRQAKAKEEESNICASFELREDLVQNSKTENKAPEKTGSFDVLDTKEIRKNVYIQKIINKSNDPRMGVDVTLLQELKDFRIIRVMDSHGNMVKKLPKDPGNTEALCLIASMLEEVQAKRERITEIKIGLYHLKKEYEKLWILTDTWLTKNYSNLFSSRKKDVKEALISDIIPEVDDKLSLIEEIQAVSDLVDNQLNGTHFSLKEISNIGQAILARKPVPYYGGDRP